MKDLTITIDHATHKVKKGLTVLEAAQSVGIHIPSLCYMKLHDIDIENKPGGCRICVVEVKGRKNLVPSCCTEVEEGMEIQTHSMRVINARRTVM